MTAPVVEVPECDGPDPWARSITDVLCEVKQKVGTVRKEGQFKADTRGGNSTVKYNFRGVDQVVNACAGPLNDAGVMILPELRSIDYHDGTTSGGSAMTWVRVVVRFRFQWRDQHLDVVVPGEGFDSSDKGTAKAMSVALRIALLQALNLPTDDPDPDEVRIERGHAAAPVDPDEGTKRAKRWLIHWFTEAKAGEHAAAFSSDLWAKKARGTDWPQAAIDNLEREVEQYLAALHDIAGASAPVEEAVEA